MNKLFFLYQIEIKIMLAFSIITCLILCYNIVT